MPVDHRTRQPFGLLHGGASVALAETLGSVAANYCVDMTRFYCVGQEINANHLRSVRSGRVTGTARPIHLGGRSQVWDIRIEDEAGRLSCVSRLTMSVLEAPAGGTPPMGEKSAAMTPTSRLAIHTAAMLRAHAAGGLRTEGAARTAGKIGTA